MQRRKKPPASVFRPSERLEIGSFFRHIRSDGLTVWAWVACNTSTRYSCFIFLLLGSSWFRAPLKIPVLGQMSPDGHPWKCPWDYASRMVWTFSESFVWNLQDFAMGGEITFCWYRTLVWYSMLIYWNVLYLCWYVQYVLYLHIYWYVVLPCFRCKSGNGHVTYTSKIYIGKCVGTLLWYVVLIGWISLKGIQVKISYNGTQNEYQFIPILQISGRSSPHDS